MTVKLRAYVKVGRVNARIVFFCITSVWLFGINMTKMNKEGGATVIDRHGPGLDFCVGLDQTVCQEDK